MMLTLRGLRALAAGYQVESYVQDVASEMEALGYDAVVTDPTGPDVEVCMSVPGESRLCTDLVESGTPWVKYAPSNIANIQSERYRFIHHLDEDLEKEAAEPSSTGAHVSTTSRTITAAAVERTPAESTSVQTDAEEKAREASVPSPLSSLLSNPWVLVGGAAAVLFLMRGSK